MSIQKEVEISVVESLGKDGVSFPLLLSFPQGSHPSGDSMPLRITRSISNASRSSLLSTSSSKIIKTKIESEGLERIVYEGVDFFNAADPSNIGTGVSAKSTRASHYTNYAIGVISNSDKKSKSGLMKVYPCSHIYVMRTRRIHEENVEDKEMTGAERRESLTTEFGSKKKKKALSAQKSAIISAENISGASSLQQVLTGQAPELSDEQLALAEQVVQKASRKRNRGRG